MISSKIWRKPKAVLFPQLKEMHKLSTDYISLCIFLAASLWKHTLWSKSSCIQTPIGNKLLNCRSLLHHWYYCKLNCQKKSQCTDLLKKNGTKYSVVALNHSLLNYYKNNILIYICKHINGRYCDIVIKSGINLVKNTNIQIIEK